MIHCAVGISRSPTMGLAVICQRNIEAEGFTIPASVELLFKDNPHSMPNARIVVLLMKCLDIAGSCMS